MNSNNISIKAISELLDCNFFIPSYQRGYRWTEQQVKDLLDDIWEFINKQNKKDDEWYCLQPVVVIKSDDDTKNKNNLIGDWYDVIDGQQRLTTTLLILKNLDRFLESKRKNFKIQYETRKGSEAFLTEIDSKSEDDSKINIDYFHIYNAYTAIKTWFQKKENEGHSSLGSMFITSFLEKVKIIWYETSKSDSIDVFTRLNSGKIPLTNAELIKALFLNSSNFANTDEVKLGLIQREIASEWDRIEYALQDDSFWYLINKSENKLATRIEFIFNLMYQLAQANDEENIKRELLKIITKGQIEERRKEHPSIYERFGNDEYSTFRYFNDQFKEKSINEIDKNWKEIKKYYQTLEEWYNDRELYHKVGYLITVGAEIKDILKESKGNSKTEFANWIETKIKDVAGKKAIDELVYGVDNSQLVKILLLHNIITTLKSEDTSLRFPFNKYKDKKNGSWSLEHIHAQNSEDIMETSDFDEWLKVVDEKEYTEELRKKLSDYKSDKQKENIPVLVKEISEMFGELGIHSIENIALLSQSDNSKLNNGLFPIKRDRIIEIEMKGGFIPNTTKKVFQKYYKGCTKQLSKWEEKDRDAYLNDIKTTLNKYLPKTDLVENEQ